MRNPAAGSHYKGMRNITSVLLLAMASIGWQSPAVAAERIASKAAPGPGPSGAATDPVLPAQARARPPVAAEKTTRTDAAHARQAGDAEVERAIRARFAKSKIGRENFQVKVQGGVATIEGTTDVIQRKGTATRLAKLAGARAVDNRIEVSEAARRKAVAGFRGDKPAAGAPRKAQVQ